jgi:hypothetical protein
MATPDVASDFGLRISDFGFLHWRSHVDLHHELPPSLWDRSHNEGYVNFKIMGLINRNFFYKPGTTDMGVR